MNKQNLQKIGMNAQRTYRKIFIHLPIVLYMQLIIVTSIYANPISNRQAGISENVYITVQNDTYGIEQRVCSIDSMTYEDGESIPTSSPCEHCICRPPGFACTIISCEYRPGCKALKRSDQCCPEYQCECEKDGKIYQNGEKILDDSNPCEICYCQGGDVVCAVIDCYWRSDCQPRYIENRCCPLYDHCPPPAGVDRGPYRSTTSTPKPSEIYDTSTISWFNNSSGSIYATRKTTVPPTVSTTNLMNIVTNEMSNIDPIQNEISHNEQEAVSSSIVESSTPYVSIQNASSSAKPVIVEDSSASSVESETEYPDVVISNTENESISSLDASITPPESTKNSSAPSSSIDSIFVVQSLLNESIPHLAESVPVTPLQEVETSTAEPSISSSEVFPTEGSSSIGTTSSPASELSSEKELAQSEPVTSLEESTTLKPLHSELEELSTFPIGSSNNFSTAMPPEVPSPSLIQDDLSDNIGISTSNPIDPINEALPTEIPTEEVGIATSGLSEDAVILDAEVPDNAPLVVDEQPPTIIDILTSPNVSSVSMVPVPLTRPEDLTNTPDLSPTNVYPSTILPDTETSTSFPSSSSGSEMNALGLEEKGDVSKDTDSIMINNLNEDIASTPNEEISTTPSTANIEEVQTVKNIPDVEDSPVKSKVPQDVMDIKTESDIDSTTELNSAPLATQSVSDVVTELPLDIFVTAKTENKTDEISNFMEPPKLDEVKNMNQAQINYTELDTLVPTELMPPSPVIDFKEPVPVVIVDFETGLTEKPISSAPSIPTVSQPNLVQSNESTDLLIENSETPELTTVISIPAEEEERNSESPLQHDSPIVKGNDEIDQAFTEEVELITTAEPVVTTSMTDSISQSDNEQGELGPIPNDHEFEPKEIITTMEPSHISSNDDKYRLDLAIFSNENTNDGEENLTTESIVVNRKGDEETHVEESLKDQNQVRHHLPNHTSDEEVEHTTISPTILTNETSVEDIKSSNSNRIELISKGEYPLKKIEPISDDIDQRSSLFNLGSNLMSENDNEVSNIHSNNWYYRTFERIRSLFPAQPEKSSRQPRNS